MADPNRRRFLEAAGASTFALVGGCLGSPASHPITAPVTRWSSFRGDRYNTGFARGVSPTSSDPSIEWTYETGGDVWSSPVVVDGTVFVGSADHALYALDAASGDRLWSYETDHRIEGTPTYDDGTVYVGSFDQHVHAIDAESGERRWKRDVGGLVRGSPAVVDGAVYIGVGCHNLACAEHAAEAGLSENGWIYALDAASGETDWRHDVGTEVLSTPAVDGGTVYVGASDGTVYALTAASGDVEWTYDAYDMVWSSPAVAFGSVFFADWDGFVHAVDAASGEREWEVNTRGHYVSGSVAVDDDAVYVGHTPFNSIDDPSIYYGEVFCFDRTDGETEWTFETTALEVGSSPVVTDDRLYVATHRQVESDGSGIHALSTDGEEEWFMEIGELGVGSSPALVDGTLYFGSVEGQVYAVA